MRAATEIVVRHRRLVLMTWFVLFVLGVAAATSLGSLLSNRFSVPGSDAERGLTILRTEFGVGLSAAILLDATLVRALLVPAAMKLLGRWNWYLPEGVRRALRLNPSGAVVEH